MLIKILTKENGGTLPDRVFGQMTVTLGLFESLSLREKPGLTETDSQFLIQKLFARISPSLCKQRIGISINHVFSYNFYPQEIVSYHLIGNNSEN